MYVYVLKDQAKIRQLLPKLATQALLKMRSYLSGTYAELVSSCVDPYEAKKALISELYGTAGSLENSVAKLSDTFHSLSLGTFGSVTAMRTALVDINLDIKVLLPEKKFSDRDILRRILTSGQGVEQYRDICGRHLSELGKTAHGLSMSSIYQELQSFEATFTTPPLHKVNRAIERGRGTKRT
jgi:hypothetical protein